MLNLIVYTRGSAQSNLSGGYTLLKSIVELH